MIWDYLECRRDKFLILNHLGLREFFFNQVSGADPVKIFHMHDTWSSVGVWVIAQIWGGMPLR